VSHDTPEASEQAAGLVRGELARRSGGWCTNERYQVPVFAQEAWLHGGDEARLTRIEVKPSAVADVIEVFGVSAVPGLAETPGFRGALLFADPGSGRLISESAWSDRQYALDLAIPVRWKRLHNQIHGEAAGGPFSGSDAGHYAQMLAAGFPGRRRGSYRHRSTRLPPRTRNLTMKR
jgi:hypothetical protein